MLCSPSDIFLTRFHLNLCLKQLDNEVNLESSRDLLTSTAVGKSLSTTQTLRDHFKKFPSTLRSSQFFLGLYLVSVSPDSYSLLTFTDGRPCPSCCQCRGSGVFHLPPLGGVPRDLVGCVEAVWIPSAPALLRAGVSRAWHAALPCAFGFAAYPNSPRVAVAGFGSHRQSADGYMGSRSASRLD